MARSAPPTAAELQTALQAAGIFAIPPTARQALFDLQGALDAALEDFQHRTGINPLIAEEEDSVRRYDPPGPYYKNKYWTVGGDRLTLLLRPPYQSITEVKVYDDPSVVSDGQVLVEDRDYVLEPPNRIENTQITGVRFRFAIVGGRQSVVITGACGFWAEFIPEDVWQALMAGAMARVLQDLRAGITSKPTDWKEGDSAEKYNVETLLKLGQSQQDRFEDEVMSHMQIYI